MTRWPSGPDGMAAVGRLAKEGAGDTSLFRLVGDAVAATGTSHFITQLLTLIGHIVEHDYLWAVRYDRAHGTTVFETRIIDQRIVDDYANVYHEDDPFARYWRKTFNAGLVTVDQAWDDSASTKRYQREFQRRAEIRDEIGILLPMHGDACLGLFVESRGRIDAAQRRTLATAMPMVEELHYAHIAKLLTQQPASLRADPVDGIVTPILITDRHGERVYSNRSWDELRGRIVDFSDVFHTIKTQGNGQIVAREFSAHFRLLDNSHVLAPGGQAIVIDWHGSLALGKAAVKLPPAAALTRLEQEILALVLQTRSTGEIATELRISKETIKKYKLRLYRKFRVHSERQLVAYCEEGRPA